ncbi:single-stranded DNA-binding protein [Candidatus Peribacteria bacterium]|jgi:single-strand DNA-binding protein|nr:single-stranded DNA-binding protein [Candidatus Peribacteria bacterium]MBT4021608.1 single-stranded DNA-binding protein [Candidatus Peribacteria bacterium]MBT4240497.1 single-stranded DNA-binding protein [Candidatus Peribacteria bacterium]MBT4474322.1 single-stranded DNA-binding protein [Candidatus Peribacteria bacterium]
MKSVNKVMLLGNVTRDPQIKSKPGGQPVVTFGLATNRTWKDLDGKKQSLAEFHNLVAWGKLAEFISENVTKGKPLFIEGYLKTRNWDSPEGTKIFRTEVVVENIVLVGPKLDTNTNSSEIETTEDPLKIETDPLAIEPIEALI